MSDYIKLCGIYLTYNNSDNWVILNSIEASIKEKIERNGVKLSDWNSSINHGILTGYNDAFIIDETTKNALISSDAKSAELIRPESFIPFSFLLVKIEISLFGTGIIPLLYCFTIKCIYNKKKKFLKSLILPSTINIAI